jgi:hypothetical protein
MLLAAGIFSTSALAQSVVGVYKSGGLDAYVAEFETVTGNRSGPGGYLDAGDHIKFADMGAMTFAPDGSLWGVYRSGGTGAFFGQFNLATGKRTGNGGYLSAGDPITFDSIGAMTFAPDGTAWGVYRSGGSNAFFGQFDPLTGDHISNGGYLDAGGTLAFNEVGAMAFAPDGTLWGIYRSGGGRAFLAQFDPTTGHRIDIGGYLSTGDFLAFDDVGALAFDPNGILWGAYKTSDGDAFFGQFNRLTGLRVGTGVYPQAGEHTPFSNLGAMTFEPASAAAVPEPAAWTMLVFGFGAIGVALRSRKTTVGIATLFSSSGNCVG